KPTRERCRLSVANGYVRNLGSYDYPIFKARKMPQQTAGTKMTIAAAQYSIPRKRPARLSSSVFAIISAPPVENGDESTAEAEIQSAITKPISGKSPANKRGAASGTNAPNIALVEANADTIPAT